MTEGGPLVVVVDDARLTKDAARRVRAVSARIELIERMSPAALEKADVIFTSTVTFDPPRASRLKWVQTADASIAHLMNTPLARSGVPVANVRGAYSASVAELAVGMLLALTRRLARCLAMQAEGRWPGDDDCLRFWGEDCYGKTLGILGYGSIGRQVGRIVAAMGMTVLACSRRGCRSEDEEFCLPGTGDRDGAIPAQWYRYDQLDKLLPRCDALVLSLPLTRQTRRMVGERELALLPDGAYLVDVGRGGVLDLDALCRCLQSGKLAGAGLDVFEEEPLPRASPLWTLPNVLMAPHIGSGTTMRSEFAAMVLIENLTRFLDGRRLLNLVDFTRGY